MHCKIISEYYQKYKSIKINSIINVIIGLMIVTSCSTERKVSNDAIQNSKPSTVVSEHINIQSDLQPIHTDVVPNSNANTDINASGLEIPHLNENYTYAAHSVNVNGKTIMNLAVEWVNEKKHSNWVAFSFDSITSQDLIKRTNKWDNDPILQANTDATYWNNLHLYDGFDKGHLCASEDRVYCIDANEQTFYYSNISPQFKTFNAGFWQKLEYKIQDWGRLTLDKIYDKVYVVKGGTINNLIKNYYAKHKNSDGQWPNTDKNGFTKGGIPCPKYYFIAILSVKDNNYNSIGFWVEHREDLPSNPKAKDLKACTMSIDELEKLTTIDFFCNLPDDLEVQVEANIDLNSWIW